MVLRASSPSYMPENSSYDRDLASADRRVVSSGAPRRAQLRRLDTRSLSEAAANALAIAPECLRRKPHYVLGAYLLASIPVFGHYEGWPPSDCVYFLITTLTTVGYGDLCPRHSASRLFACLYIVSALLLIVAGLTTFLTDFVSLEVKAAKSMLSKTLRMSLKQAQAVDVFDVESQREQRKRRFKRQLWILSAFILLSSIVAYRVLWLERWIDALYFSIVTLTTVGFGDIVPKTPTAKWAIALLCMVGVPLFGNTVATLVSLVYGEEQQRRDIFQVMGGLTASKLTGLQQFHSAMCARGLLKGNEDCEPKIEPFEFCCFLLLRSGRITMDDLDIMLRNFNELDLEGDGCLWSQDLARWEHQRTPDLSGA